MKGSIVLFGFCLILSETYAAGIKYRTVKTNTGTVRGIREQTLLNKIDYFSFKGIPYAKAPIGDLRFKAPEPVDSWSPQTLDAYEYGNTCIRPNDFLIVDDFPQSEDCLFLNVFVPAGYGLAKRDSKLAVMVFIHGGGFSDWSGNDELFGPDFLIEQGVILVTLNYRLGVLGFLSFGTPEYSGNMGLKDQQLALKWVHENIDQFYGDSQRITVFGDSDGGVSTHFHVLSSESRKYFRNAIIMSGTADSVWALGNEERQISLAYQIAEELEQPKDSIEELIELFKSMPFEEIVNYDSMDDSLEETDESKSDGADDKDDSVNDSDDDVDDDDDYDDSDFTFDFAPIIERKDAKKPFMTKSLHESYNTSNIHTDIMFFLASSELGAFSDFMGPMIATSDDWDWDNDFELELPFNIFNLSTHSDEYQSLAKEVRQFYFGDTPNVDEISEQYLNMFNDVLFNYPNHKSMKNHLNQSKGRVYFVQFSVNSTLNLLKRMLNSTSTGASHFDVLCYLFRGNVCQQYYDEMLENKDLEQPQVSLQQIENVSRLFASYATFGGKLMEKHELIEDFHAINNDEFNVFDINNDGFSVAEDPRKSANAFWTQLEEKARQFMMKYTTN